MSSRRLRLAAVAVIVFIVFITALKTCSSSTRVPTCSSSCPSSSFPPPPSLSSLSPSDSLLRELSTVVAVWQHALQTDGSVLSAASSSLSTPALDALLSRRSTKLLHFTSYHFPHTRALSNWALHLRALDSKSSASSLVAFVRSKELFSDAKHANVEAIDGQHFIEPFPLCHRDPGSGIKVAALLELLRRGIDAIYSDADVVWFGAPEQMIASSAPDADLAIQVYGTSVDKDSVLNGNFGMNFGLFFARANPRTQAVFRRLLRAMIRSLEIHDHAPHFSFDTCNDQNNLNNLLLRWSPDLVCGYYYESEYWARSGHVSPDCIKIRLLSPKQFVMATEFIQMQGVRDHSIVAVHMTGFRGGHTFAKAFAMMQLGLWHENLMKQAIAESQRQQAKWLLWPKDDTSILSSYSTLRTAVALALSTRRTLWLPKCTTCGTLHRIVKLDRLLILSRALCGAVGYKGKVDRIEDAKLQAEFGGKIPGCLFAPPNAPLPSSEVISVSWNALLQADNPNQFVQLRDSNIEITESRILSLVDAYVVKNNEQL